VAKVPSKIAQEYLGLCPTCTKLQGMFLDTLRVLYQYKVITRDEYARIVERVFGDDKE
jgi:hypothetical protein